MEGDALELPFCDSYFDAITIGYGLRNVVDRQKVMVEMYRVLKPGSNVSVLDFNKSSDAFSTLIQVLLQTNKSIPFYHVILFKVETHVDLVALNSLINPMP